VDLVGFTLAGLIAGVSLANLAAPLLAWTRTREARFWLVAGANGCLFLLGALWAVGEFPGAPEWTTAEVPVLAVALAATVLLLGSTLWPRRA